MSWVCDACSSSVWSHPCRALYQPCEAEGGALEDGFAALKFFQQLDAQAIDFAVLGNLAKGRVLVVKEGNNVVLVEAGGGREAACFDQTARLSARVTVAYCIVDARSTGCVEEINGLCHKLLTYCQESS